MLPMFHRSRIKHKDIINILAEICKYMMNIQIVRLNVVLYEFHMKIKQEIFQYWFPGDCLSHKYCV